MFTHAGHVILQLILYKLCSKTSLQAFQPHKLPILISQFHPAWRLIPPVSRHMWDIQHILFFATSQLPLENFCMNHIVTRVELTHICCSYHSAANTLQVFQQNIATSFPILTSHLKSAEELLLNLVSHPYLIFRNNWDIEHFLFF